MQQDRAKILIVEDNPDLLDLAEQELMDDYDVVPVSSGEAALEEVKGWTPDCILLDVQMPPGMSGLDVLRELRAPESNLHIPVILLTGMADMEDRVAGLDAGADDYIIKPFDSDDLHARLRVAVRMGRLEKDLAREQDELRNTLEELKANEAQLVHSEKMAGLGKLVAGVAHELNNPIGFIYANMDHFRRYIGELRKVCETASLGEEEENRSARAFQTLNKLIDSCSDGAQRIKEIVLDLRTFSRLDEAELKAVDILEGIESTLTLMEHHLKDRVVVVKDFEKLPPVVCYAGQLNQVFMNLIQNAADAIEGEGEVTISTRAMDNEVRISVADTGVGIPEEIQKQVFDPFFTTKDVGKGTGLGLSTSYGIVKKHGGSIEVKSEIGKGSEFSIILPLKIQNQESEPE